MSDVEMRQQLESVVSTVNGPSAEQSDYLFALAALATVSNVILQVTVDGESRGYVFIGLDNGDTHDTLFDTWWHSVGSAGPTKDEAKDLELFMKEKCETAFALGLAQGEAELERREAAKGGGKA